MWVVKLIKRPVNFPWKEDYFPRMVRYKSDAESIMIDVVLRGGQAEILKEPKITAKQEGGNDGYCYVVRIDGKEFVNGLTRPEVPYYKEQALKSWMEKHK